MDDIGTAFGTRLRLLLELADERQVDLAKFLNVAEATVSRYANGRIPDDIGTLTKIADHFRVELDYLIGRTPNTDEEKEVDILGAEWRATARLAKKLGIGPSALAPAIRFLADLQQSKRRED